MAQNLGFEVWGCGSRVHGEGYQHISLVALEQDHHTLHIYIYKYICTFVYNMYMCMYIGRYVCIGNYISIYVLHIYINTYVRLYTICIYVCT